MENSFSSFKKSEKKSYKLKKYFEVYDEIFKDYVNKKITFVEVGVLDGGSLEMWRNFFGEDARIIGIDLNPNCKRFEKKGIEIFIGDQGDPHFWSEFFKEVGKVDVILDDGSHKNDHQIITTINAVPNINDGGVLVFEDTCTSYWSKFGNPHKYSFINFSKKIIDDINFTYPDLPNFKLSLNNHIFSIRYFESLCIFYIDKKRCYTNSRVENEGNKAGNENYVNKKSKFRNIARNLTKFMPILNKIKLIKYIYKFLILINLKLKNYSLKKFFK